MRQEDKNAAICVSSWYRVKRKIDHLLSLETVGESRLFCPVCLEQEDKCQNKEHKLVSSTPYISLEQALDTAKWWLSVFSSESSAICVKEPDSYTEAPKPVLPYPESISIEQTEDFVPDYNYAIVSIPATEIYGFTSDNKCYLLDGNQIDINKPKYAFNVSGASTMAWGGIAPDRNRRWLPIAWFSDGGWVVAGDSIPMEYMAVFPEGLSIKEALLRMVPNLKNQPKEFLVYPAGFSSTLEMFERSLCIQWFT